MCDILVMVQDEGVDVRGGTSETKHRFFRDSSCLELLVAEGDQVPHVARRVRDGRLHRRLVVHASVRDEQGFHLLPRQASPARNERQGTVGGEVWDAMITAAAASTTSSGLGGTLPLDRRRGRVALIPPRKWIVRGA